jgi:hypothetical protein
MNSMLKEMLSESGGGLSTMRIVISVVIFVIVGTWAQHCIRTETLVGFDYEEVAMVIGLLGVKAYQKGKEVK